MLRTSWFLRSSAVCRPMPRLAPVMNAIFCAIGEVSPVLISIRGGWVGVQEVFEWGVRVG